MSVESVGQALIMWNITGERPGIEGWEFVASMNRLVASHVDGGESITVSAPVTGWEQSWPYREPYSVSRDAVYQTDRCQYCGNDEFNGYECGAV